MLFLEDEDVLTGKTLNIIENGIHAFSLNSAFCINRSTTMFWKPINSRLCTPPDTCTVKISNGKCSQYIANTLQ